MNITDKSLMPFGTHKGIEMWKVPSDYLDWARGQKWIDRWPEVRDYIDANRKSIDQDLKQAGLI